jgi:hypothetical protein
MPNMMQPESRIKSGEPTPSPYVSGRGKFVNPTSLRSRSASGLERSIAFFISFSCGVIQLIIALWSGSCHPVCKVVDVTQKIANGAQDACVVYKQSSGGINWYVKADERSMLRRALLGDQVRPDGCR